MELVTTMVLNFATKLDAHLARFAAPPSKQLKPETTVNTISCKAACGETFSVRLLDASNTHEVKRAEVKDRSVVVQVGKEPGKTTVTLIVVRGTIWPWARRRCKLRLRIGDGARDGIAWM